MRLHSEWSHDFLFANFRVTNPLFASYLNTFAEWKNRDVPIWKERERFALKYECENSLRRSFVSSFSRLCSCHLLFPLLFRCNKQAQLLIARKVCKARNCSTFEHPDFGTQHGIMNAHHSSTFAERDQVEWGLAN